MALIALSSLIRPGPTGSAARTHQNVACGPIRQCRLPKFALCQLCRSRTMAACSGCGPRISTCASLACSTPGVSTEDDPELVQGPDGLRRLAARADRALYHGRSWQAGRHAHQSDHAPCTRRCARIRRSRQSSTILSSRSARHRAMPSYSRVASGRIGIAMAMKCGLHEGFNRRRGDQRGPADRHLIFQNVWDVPVRKPALLDGR